MCLTISKRAKLKTATKDIVVYKYGTYNNFHAFISPHSFFQYEFNKLYSTTITELSYDDCALFADGKEREDYGFIGWAGVNEFLIRRNLTMYVKGFHSYGSVERAKYSNYKDYTLAECIIPKGSLYMRNKSNVLISNQIIIKRCVS